MIGSLLIGLAAGYLGQRSRMCFVGGFRDLLLVGDKELLKGAISFFASAWLTIMALNLVGRMAPGLAELTEVRLVTYPYFIDALWSRFGVISIVGGFGLGLFSTLAGGCPLRQHVMAGQGKVESMVYLAGFYIGIIIYYIFTVRLVAILF